MVLQIELAQETDGRWIAEVLELPGVMAYGSSRAEAIVRVMKLALKRLEEQKDQDSGQDKDKDVRN